MLPLRVATLNLRSLLCAGLLALVSLPAPSSGQASTSDAGGGSRSVVRRGTVARARPKARRAARRPPPPPLVATTPFGIAALRSDLGSLLEARVKQGTWGVLVTSVSRGDTLFGRNADQPLRPASTQKLFTTVLAFERLGVHHQIVTEVLRDGSLDADGTLRGSLVLRGGGDPALAGRFLGGSPESPMRALAQMVANAGIRRVTGDVVGDASAFENQRIPDGWLSRYLGASYAARVSALSLNANLLHVAVAPGKGTRPTVSLHPGLAGFPVVNNARVTGTSRSARLVVSRRSDRTIVVSGWIGKRSETRVYTVVVEDPATFATAAFRQALEDAGIDVAGKVRLGTAPAQAITVGALTSPPIAQLARVMNGESDNHFAELLLRDAARGRDPAIVGSARLGNEQLRALLAERAGTTPAGISIADGSGLSSLNRVTPRALTELLMYADRAPWSREFHESLPIAGASETLRSRMVGTSAQRNLHAKTGTTNDVISLGGYVTSRGGELLAFTVFYNGSERWNARETIDAIGATLAGFAR
ncbi:MAG: D-alanyl-D-alanine carboxypeptidase/D-alanyl-D-alanine-endopeptidase [Gemmatimonadaceae bacterium]|nr:D-alanyl-D-alanine carboxypeptidase/D-alanyl-D-alanine-endopeptidase [Gemmatimonadaceae bacterium]